MENTKEPIRILHCLPGDMNQGGIENFIMNLYKKIDRSKIQFDFIVHSQETSFYEKEIKELGGKIYRITYKSKNFKKYQNEFIHLLKEHKEYKIIHIHATYAISAFDAKIAKKMGLKVIVHAHSSNDILKRKIVHFLLKYQLNKNSEYKFACSTKASDWLFGKKYRNQVTIIKNAIDSEKFIYNENIRNNEREKLKINNKFVVGIVSRLSYLKNIDFLIEIFKEISQIEKDAVLLIVGDGPERLKLENKVEELKLGKKVIFLGNYTKVNEVLQAIDVFVMPSKCEGFGISLLEAQAVSLKCFTSEGVVPKEIKLNNNPNMLEFISLKMSAKEWAQKILIWNKKYERINMKLLIKKAGYDLESNIQFIENKYIKILGE